MTKAELEIKYQELQEEYADLESKYDDYVGCYSEMEDRLYRMEETIAELRDQKSFTNLIDWLQREDVDETFIRKIEYYMWNRGIEE